MKKSKIKTHYKRHVINHIQLEWYKSLEEAREGL